jgi:hypothetical protein
MNRSQAQGWCVAVALVLTCLLTGCGTPGANIRWSPYPTLWPAPTSGHNWVVVKCQFSDVKDIPSGLDADIEQFLGLPGAGFGNIVDYFHDVSYGATTVFAGAIVPWVTTNIATADIATGGRLFGSDKRGARVSECLSAIPPGQAPDFAGYYGVIAITNAVNDGGACYDGQADLRVSDQTYRLACVWFDPNSLFTAFAAHEIGHGLGLPHSYDDSQSNCGGQPGEYCDSWDIMSALGTLQFVDRNWLIAGNASSAGPGMSLPNLLQMGWLPDRRFETFQFSEDGSEQIFTLGALSHPNAGDKLGIIVALGIRPGDGAYTIEYRQGDGWDQGFVTNPNSPVPARLQGGAVLVHLWRSPGTPPSTLIETADSGALVPGQTLNFTGTSGISAHVTVQRFDTISGTATVAIGAGRR